MAKKSKENSDGETNFDFEKALDQLQTIVRELESGQLTLDQSLARYEMGVGCLRHCHQSLQRVEQRIRLLVDVDEDGRAITKPFAHTATAEKPRRSQTKQSQANNNNANRGNEVDEGDIQGEQQGNELF
jgi:exodeoxyribonuclease VII small subunit